MDDVAVSGTAAGVCTQCGGDLAAAHMLTKTYKIDHAGRWERVLSDFPEDVVVVCRICGTEQDGRIDDDGSRFAFTRSPQGSIIQHQDGR